MPRTIERRPDEDKADPHVLRHDLERIGGLLDAIQDPHGRNVNLPD
jgi:hypothetical protein